MCCGTTAVREPCSSAWDANVASVLESREVIKSFGRFNQQPRRIVTGDRLAMSRCDECREEIRAGEPNQEPRLSRW